MNLEQLKIVLKYIICKKKTGTNTAAAMKAFNEARLIVATKAREVLCNSDDLIQCLRRATSVQQIQAVPHNVTCCVSGETLIDRTGVTIIVKREKQERIFCIHSRFVDMCYQMFITTHFDLHIKHHFQKWCKQQPWWMPGDFSQEVLQRYINFNNNRNLKLLLIQLNQHIG
jgi:hypothetical protein